MNAVNPLCPVEEGGVAAGAHVGQDAGDGGVGRERFAEEALEAGEEGGRAIVGGESLTGENGGGGADS